MLYPNPELSLPNKDNPLFTNPERKAIIISLKKKKENVIKQAKPRIWTQAVGLVYVELIFKHKFMIKICLIQCLQDTKKRGKVS